MRVAGKVWVITGGGGGMGRELVIQLLGRGASVAAVDRDPAALGGTADAAGTNRSRLSTHVVDITDRTAVRGLPAEVVAIHGTVDGLINNAGVIQPFVPVAELDDATIERVLDVNLMGTLHMVQAFLPVLATRPEAHLANVSSMGGFFPFPGQTLYGASKAAVRLLTEGLYAELAGHQHRRVGDLSRRGQHRHLEELGDRDARHRGPGQDADPVARQGGHDHDPWHREEQAAHLRRPRLQADEYRDQGRPTTRDPLRTTADEQTTPGLSHPIEAVKAKAAARHSHGSDPRHTAACRAHEAYRICRVEDVRATVRN